MSETVRDGYIDFMKAICIVGIVFTHTVFYSGRSYVPEWMWNLCLAIDVPQFFFITGAILGQKNMKPNFFLTQVFKLSMLFTGTVILFQCLFLRPDISVIAQALFLNGASIPGFSAFKGSYWFVPIYVKALFLSLIIINYIPRLTWIVIFSALAYISFLTFSPDIKSGVFLGSRISTVLFYCIFILIGYSLYGYSNKFFWKMLLAASCIIFGSLWVAQPNLNMQHNKFPSPTIIYFIYSWISISLFMIFKYSSPSHISLSPITHSRIIHWMGKNALYLYISQGISSSLIYGLVKNLHLRFWPVKLLLVFIVNLGLSLAIGWGLSKIFSLVASCPVIATIRGRPIPSSRTA